MSDWKIAVLAGDGVGPEVIPVAIELLSAALADVEASVAVEAYPIGWAAMRHGLPSLPTATFEACRDADAVLVGAVGDPAADHLPPEERPVSGLLKLRRELGCYANLRPVRVTDSLVSSSVLDPTVVEGTDILIVRELAGGLYYGEPRTLEPARATNTLAYDADEIRRIADLAFRLARDRGGRVTSVDKANVLETSRLWRSVVAGVAADHPDIELDHMLVDRAAFELVARPTRFDTILTSNLFGDILSDAAAGLIGSLGPLGSASLGGTTDIYEPVHGSAPDIAGTGSANPMGAIASVALMLRHSLGQPEAAARLETAVERTLSRGVRPPDLPIRPGRGGGYGRPVSEPRPAGTVAFGRAVAEELAS